MKKQSRYSVKKILVISSLSLFGLAIVFLSQHIEPPITEKIIVIDHASLKAE